MYYKSHNREIVIGVDANEFMEELFNLHLHRLQVSLEESMRGRNFGLEYVESAER